MSSDYWKSQTDTWRLWTAAKKRCKQSGMDFTISIGDIPKMPQYCPITGLEMRMAEGGRARDYSPSLDRIDNNKGYVPGNIRIISWRANNIKKDATLEEIRRLYLYSIGEL